MRAASVKTTRTWLILLLGAIFGFTPTFGQEPAAPAAKSPSDKSTDNSIPSISKRGPGMKGPATGLKLPVPRTFDLTHVEPEHFAVALGKDPQRIFEFVRDHVAYEAYAGCLRGSRGTLLAMAGNSVDRAALLGALLEKSGQRVRFVRGTLPEANAAELVTSMWSERPRPALKSGNNPSPALKAALNTLVTGVKRDYNLIRDHLQKSDKLPARQPASSLDELVTEARPHFWVQWSKDDKWIDLDPSFADSIVGATHAKAEETLAALPVSLYHRATIRLQIEEYGILLKGNAEAKVSKREILRFTAKAADLSGVDLILTHQPDNWQKPATDVKSALAAAVEDTGKVKPVLLIGLDKWIAGEAFRQKLPAGAGLGSVFSGLSGEGTRTPIPIATALSIEFDFLAPGGRKETVVREIFDLVGKKRRATGKNLNGDDVRAKTQAVDELARSVYDLSFTTGRVEAVHLADVANLSMKKGDPSNLLVAMRYVNIMFAVTSDMLLERFGQADRALVRFYPDSPRVQILELSAVAGKNRLAMDLRRDHIRAVAMGPHPQDVFSARIFRGVVDGTLERVLIELLIAGLPEKERLQRGPIMSTSSLFERAQAEGVSSMLLTKETTGFGKDVPDDVRARLREEITSGSWALVPEKVIALGKAPRYAWWRINARSGETTAVTDEGLHGAGPTERIGFQFVQNQLVIVMIIIIPGGIDEIFFVNFETLQELNEYVNYLISRGGTLW